VHDAPDTARRIGAFREDLRAVRTRAAGWTLDDGGYEAIGGALARTYARARAALAEAWADPTPENMHEWRKRVKYHWYHARILVTVNHPMIGPQAEGADRLADLLGDHHDLAVFDERLTSEPGDFGPNTDLDGFRALMLRRRTELEAAAFADGRRLLAEDADALVDRWGAYWSVWTKGGGRPGELVL